jgi:hypothetical protein
MRMNELHDLARSDESAGMSLVELVLSTALFGVIALAGVGMTLSASGAGTAVRRSAEAVTKRATFFGALSDELGRARILAIAADGSSIRYSLPVISPETGTRMDATGAPAWGIADGAERVGGSCTLRFAAVRRVSESSVRIDLNADGDIDDAFEEGVLEKVSDGGVAMPLVAPRIYLAAAGPAGDVDGDGVADPLFALDVSGLLTMNSMLASQDGRVRRAYLKVKTYETAM